MLNSPTGRSRGRAFNHVEYKTVINPPSFLASQASHTSHSANYLLLTLSAASAPHTLHIHIKPSPLLLPTLSTMKFPVLSILLLVAIPVVSALIDLQNLQGALGLAKGILSGMPKVYGTVQTFSSFPSCSVRSHLYPVYQINMLTSILSLVELHL